MQTIRPAAADRGLEVVSADASCRALGSISVDEVVGSGTEVFVGHIVPEGVGLAEKLAAVADGEDIDRGVGRFVNDSERTADTLAACGDQITGISRSPALSF